MSYDVKQVQEVLNTLASEVGDEYIKSLLTKASEKISSRSDLGAGEFTIETVPTKGTAGFIKTPAVGVKVTHNPTGNYVVCVSERSAHANKHYAITALMAMVKEQNTKSNQHAPYGYCPECGAQGISRERGINSNDGCVNGHIYPSKTAKSA